MDRLYIDNILVGLDLEKGEKSIDVIGIFENCMELKDYYSGKSVKVKGGKASIDSSYDMVLLGK